VVPGFEHGHLHFDPGRSRPLGHSNVGFDAEHLASGGLEQPGRDTGATADVNDLMACAGCGDPLYQGFGVAWPGPVVAFGIDPERLRDLPVVMRFGR
jgi:hypothetical protein